ncbi:MAG: hypothetical protein ACE5EL_05240, partial [Anaerolineae bacterium]
MTGRFPPPGRRDSPQFAAGMRFAELAESLSRDGRFEEAVDFMTRAADAFGAAGDIRAAYCRRSSAEVLLSMDRFQDARVPLEAAREQFAAARLEEEVASCDRLLGSVLQAVGESRAAQERYEAAWDAYEGQGQTVDAAHAAMGVATVLHDRREYEAALYVLDRVRTLLAEAGGDPQAVARCDMNTGNALLSLGRDEEAA